jgi:hypothetical protein
MRLQEFNSDYRRIGTSKTRIAAAFVASVVLFNAGCTSDRPVRGQLAAIHKTVKETQRRPTRAVAAACAAGKTPEGPKSDQRAAIDTREPCACDAQCGKREPQQRARALARPNQNPQSSLPREAMGVWAFSKSGCDLYKAGRFDDEHHAAQASDGGIVKITLTEIQKMHGEMASCAFSAAEISTSSLSISFPAQCHYKGREIGQFVIINMHGNDHMRLSFLAAAPYFNTADYVRCAPDDLGH